MSSEILQNVNNSRIILESLKHDHEHALTLLVGSNNFSEIPNSECECTLNDEKSAILKSVLLKIEQGLDDSEYMEYLEAEIMKVRLHNDRLTEETTWLRDELKYTQNKLEEKESLLAQLEVEKKQLDFILDLQKHESKNDYLNVNSQGKSDNVLINANFNSFAKPLMTSSVMNLKTSQFMEDNAYIHTILSKPNGFSNENRFYSHLNETMNNSLVEIDFDSNNLNSSGTINGCDKHLNFSSMYAIETRSSNDSDGGRGGSAVPPGLRTLHHIVNKYISHGKHDVASSLCKQAIKDFETSGGHYQAQVAVLYNILASVYRDQGKIEDASNALTEVIDIRTKTFGSDHLLVAAALNNLAVLYAKVGRFTDAEPLCRKALDIREKILGSEHLDVAKQLNNLALLCQNQGRFDEVEVFFRRALEVYSKHYKPGSSIIRKAKNKLASALLKQQNYTSAEKYLKSVLTPTQSERSKLHVRPIENGDRMTASAVHHCVVSDKHVPSKSPDPLWLILEASLRSADSATIMAPCKHRLNLTKWARDARIELSIVQNAVRNLAIVYQRRGLNDHANVLFLWLSVEENEKLPEHLND